jgi:hypothetical protein
MEITLVPSRDVRVSFCYFHKSDIYIHLFRERIFSMRGVLFATRYQPQLAEIDLFFVSV